MPRKRKAFAIPPTTTAREIVDALNKWADVDPELPYDERLPRHNEAAELWSYLTALRGPDNGNHDLKYETTAYIRIPLKHLASHGGAIYRTGSLPDVPKLNLVVANAFHDLDLMENEHFHCHINYAIDSLIHMGYIKHKEEPKDETTPEALDSDSSRSQSDGPTS